MPQFTLTINQSLILNEDSIIRNARTALYLQDIANDIKKSGYVKMSGDIKDSCGNVVGHYEVV